VGAALELGRLLAVGDADPVAVARKSLARARDAGSAFIAVTEERALREATESARRLRAGTPRGPLEGVPIAWKDLIDVEGVPTTAASALRRDAPPARADAPVVARLAAAGMVCVGKTNLTEFAYSGLGLNPHFGTPRNPHDPDRIPGGSSSGSAVAVAAGVVPCAIGTDTSGSIRVPAAFCRIVGFKPTAARVPREGVLALAPSLDSVGPLTRSVTDAIALDALLRGQAPPPPRRDLDLAAGGEPVAPSQLAAATDIVARLIVPDGEFVDGAEPGVAEAFAAAVDALAAAGAPIERRPLRALEDARSLFEANGSLVAHEAWRVHRALLDSPDAGRLDRRVLRRLRDGRALPPEGRDVLLRERPRLQAALETELGGALALWPTVRHGAPELAPLERDDELFARVNMTTLANTMPASFLDMPGVALPIGAASLLLSGPPGADDRVLAAALTIAERVR